MDRPKVGVGVIVYNDDNKVLLEKRKNAHGSGFRSFAGGHLEGGESIQDCARREAKEECGVEIGEIRILGITNDIFEEENKHYITIFVMGKHVSGKVALMEPHACEQRAWFVRDNLPQPLFLPIRNSLKEHLSPFDY